jgi:hypothetical protein
VKNKLRPLPFTVQKQSVKKKNPESVDYINIFPLLAFYPKIEKTEENTIQIASIIHIFRPIESDQPFYHQMVVTWKWLIYLVLYIKNFDVGSTFRF